MNSTNIKVISEEIQRLKDKVHAIDIEVPDPSQATDGQILSVDNGKYVISDPEKELPATTEAATGDVLGLVGEAKTPGWITPYTPLDYSTTEQDTGVKWIDGKEIYSKTVVIDSLPSATDADLNIECDKIIFTHGYIERTGVTSHAYVGFSDTCYVSSSAYAFTSKVGDNAAIYNSGFTGAKMTVTVYYTKLTPVLETTKATKKKTTTKKGE